MMDKNPKAFEAQLRAAFFAGKKRGREIEALSNGDILEVEAPSYVEWRRKLGDPK